MNYPMHHPANPRTHETAVHWHLESARRAKYPVTKRVAMECACESAEEFALMSGAEFSILPGADVRPVHNNIWAA